MMKMFLLALFLTVSYALVYADGKAIALCYHTFLGLNRDQYDFSPRSFGFQIRSLKKIGYRFISFADLLATNVSGNTNILITLDDGNSSIKSIYKNVLENNGIKPVLFIYPAVINRMHYALNYSDLEEFETQGASIGAHGYYHLFVTDRLYKRDPSLFRQEIYKPMEVLDRNLSNRINIYAYPYGCYSKVTVEYLKKAGYSYAFTIKPGIIKIPLERNPDSFSLPRYLVTKASWKQLYRLLKYNVRQNRRLPKGKSDEVI